MGKSIVYDTVSNLSWAVDIRTHTIVNIVEKLLGEPWGPSEEVGREVPEPTSEADCVVSVFDLRIFPTLRLYLAFRNVLAGNLGTSLHDLISLQQVVMIYPSRPLHVAQCPFTSDFAQHIVYFNGSG